MIYISGFRAHIGSQMGVKVMSVPATEHGTIQAANTAMFGALMQAGNLGLPKEAYGEASWVTFAKKPR